MPTSLQNQIKFITKDRILSTAATPTVPVSDDILFKETVEVTNGAFLAQNERGTIIEILTADVTGGEMTILSRGLDKDSTAQTSLRKERPRGTLITLIVLEDQLIDVKAGGTISGDVTVEGNVIIDDSDPTEYGFKPKSLTQAEIDANSGSRPDSVMVYNETTSSLNVKQGGAMVAVGPGATTPNMTEGVTGKGRYADQTQHDAGTDDDGGAPLVSRPSVIQKGIQSGSALYAGESTEGDDDYVVTMTPSLTAYTEGMKIRFKADVINTGACTINIDGLGVKNIKNIDLGDPNNGTIRVGVNELIYDGTNWIVNNPIIIDNNFYFGDGTDGTVTISSDTTLTQDMNYVDLTIDSGVTLYTAGYRIYVQGTFTNNGTIDRKGNDGNNGGNAALSTPGSAGIAGSTLSNGSIDIMIDAGDGGQGSSDDGEDGLPANPGYGNSNGASGGAGGGGNHQGGVGGTTTRGLYYNTLGQSAIHKYLFHPASFDSTLRTAALATYSKYKTFGSSGGGGGGIGRVSSANKGGGGGGAGSNAGTIYIAANSFNNAGVILATGGDGGDGGNGHRESTSNATGGGGGGGGSGGIVIIVTSTSYTEGTINISGGSGGTGGLGDGGGEVGSDGSDGNDGIVITHIV